MTAGFFPARDFNRIIRTSDTFDDFLQKIANYSIERFVGHTYYPPADSPNDTLSDTIEKLLNAMIESGFETSHFDKVKAIAQ